MNSHGFTLHSSKGTARVPRHAAVQQPQQPADSAEPQQRLNYPVKIIHRGQGQRRCGWSTGHRGPHVRSKRVEQCGQAAVHKPQLCPSHGLFPVPDHATDRASGMLQLPDICVQHVLTPGRPMNSPAIGHHKAGQAFSSGSTRATRRQLGTLWREIGQRAHLEMQ